MSWHSKTRRRLVMMLEVSAAAGIACGGIALYRWHAIQTKAEQGRREGITSMARGDYANALRQLGTYLARHGDDVTILSQYARARRLTEEPDGRHLLQAISLYRRVLDLNPGDSDAQKSLLDLYFQVGYNTEAITAADALLARTPSDASALRLKVLCLLRVQKLEAAEHNVGLLTRTAPLDLDGHILAIQIILARGNQNGEAANDRVLAYANNLLQQHPGDTRFELLRSIAALVTGDASTALALVRPLESRAAPDAIYTRVLIHQLDSLGLYGDAFAALQHAVRAPDNGPPDRDITRLWIRRLFETNRLNLLLDQTSELNPTAFEADTELLAMRGLALIKLNRCPEAEAMIASLRGRGHADSAAAHWAAALQVLLQNDPAKRAGALQALRSAVVIDPDNPALLQELGDAFAAAGADDKAVAAWREACRVAPAWSVPLLSISQTLAMNGRGQEALSAALAAQARSPDDPDVRVNLAAVSLVNLPQGPSPSANLLMTQLDDLQTKYPNDLTIRSLQAGVLARSGQRDAAANAIRNILTNDPPASERILLSLEGFSATSKLDLEEECFARSAKAHGTTAELALARASWLARRGRATEAAAFLETLRSGHRNDPRWDRIWATYLDLVDDDRAKDLWIALGNQNPNDVRIQWDVLNSRAAQKDRAFVGRTLDRLAKLLGEDVLAPQLARARWLLQGDSTEDVTQASLILSGIARRMPEVTSAHLLLATCYTRLGNMSAAIDQLATVADTQPNEVKVTLELAHLLQARGDLARAHRYIEQAAASASATLDDLHQAASLLSLQGDFKTALAILEKGYAGSPKPADLMLAALYRQLNQVAQAEDICRTLLEQPDAASIAFCADFYAAQGRMSDAQRTLALLDTLNLEAGGKELVRARFTAKYQSPAKALQFYQEATKIAPDQAAVWQGLVDCCLQAGEIDDALAAADQASQALAPPDRFAGLRQNTALVREAAQAPGGRSLLALLATGPTDDAAVLDGLRLIALARAKGEPPRQTAGKLRQLADRNPRILALQLVAMQYCLNGGQPDEALNVASRTLAHFPTATESLRLATMIQGATQHWEQALHTASEWRRIGLDGARDADIAIAEAELHLGNPTAAASALEPYVRNGAEDSGPSNGIMLLLAQSYLAGGQPEAAQSLLEPMLSKAPDWRNLWLTLAVRSNDDRALAKAWVEKAAPFMADNPDERTVLARAWLALGRRWSSDELTERGRVLLEPVVQHEDAPVSALESWGSICEAKADWGAAESAYRRALLRDPSAVVALNNLAYLLAQKRDSLDEALQLIERAISLAPEQPALHDTKAAVLEARKNYTLAVASMREAQRLDPQNVKWRLRLVELLVEAGQLPAARNALNGITDSMANSAETPIEFRQRLDALRARLH